MRTILLLASVLAVVPLHGGTLSTSANIEVLSCPNFGCPPLATYSASGTSNATATGSGVTVSSSASYGTIGVIGSYFGCCVILGGSASFMDTMTIYGGTGTGTLNWTFNDTCHNNFSKDVCQTLLNGLFYTPQGYGTTSFQYGVPFNIGASIMTSDDSISGLGNAGGAFQTVDFFVGTFTGIPPTIPNPVLVTYLTGSGASYPFLAGAMIPEPGTVALGTVSMLLLLFRRLSQKVTN